MRPTVAELQQLWRRTKTQTYEAAGTDVDGRPLCTAIVAMSTDMHRLPTDEIRHFYLGDPIELIGRRPHRADLVTRLSRMD